MKYADQRERARELAEARDANPYTHSKPLTAVDHVMLAATYEWKCIDCGASSYSPSEGGDTNFAPSECGSHRDASKIDIYVILNGERSFVERANAIDG